VAHEESVSTSDARISEREVVWRVDVGVDNLRRVVSLQAGADGPLDERSLRLGEEAIGRYLAHCLEIRADGATLDGTIESLESRPDRAIATLRFRSARPIVELRVGMRLFSEITSAHRALVNVTWGAESRRFVRLGPADLHLVQGRLAPRWWEVAWEFGEWGTHHIFVGYDHIAFLLALLLAVTRFRDLVAIVTSFTVAHSLTLLLSALDLVNISSRVTEVLIAASIVYVAFDNLRWAGRPLRHRWLVSFVFGLVHGLGFATELRNRLAEMSGHVILPVVCFNLGVEVGQIVIVALVFPLLTWLRSGATEYQRQVNQRRLMRMGSVPILLLGLFWLIGRMVG
jgi:hypothetical protein